MPWPKGKPRGPQSAEHVARRMAAGAHAKKGVAQTVDHIEKGRQSRIGKKLNVTPARSESMKKRWSEGVYDNLFVRNQRFSYGSLNMRSNWEVLAAQEFDSRGLTWSYEPQRFHLPSGRNYWPDFRLEESGVWVEVKGYLTDAAKEKFEEFLSLGHNAIMVSGKTDADFVSNLKDFLDSVSISTGESTALQSV